MGPAELAQRLGRVARQGLQAEPLALGAALQVLRQPDRLGLGAGLGGLLPPGAMRVLELRVPGKRPVWMALSTATADTPSRCATSEGLDSTAGS